MWQTQPLNLNAQDNTVDQQHESLRRAIDIMIVLVLVLTNSCHHQPSSTKLRMYRHCIGKHNNLLISYAYTLQSVVVRVL
jgi:hypothetical protein